MVQPFPAFALLEEPETSGSGAAFGARVWPATRLRRNRRGVGSARRVLLFPKAGLTGGAQSVNGGHRGSQSQLSGGQIF